MAAQLSSLLVVSYTFLQRLTYLYFLKEELKTCFLISALFGVLFVDKQEAAFASYRMFYATGCAIAFGYSYFLCVETKVYILAAMLTVSLVMYSVIEMKVQLQSQHIKDIVAF